MLYLIDWNIHKKDIPEYKKCVFCHETKQQSEFSRKSESHDGLQSRCKECTKKYNEKIKKKEKIKVKEKLCTKCNKVKSIESFYKFSMSRDGHKSMCKSCDIEVKRIYRSEYLDDLRERRKESKVFEYRCIPFDISQEDLNSMSGIYKECYFLNKTNNTDLQVDHIVPKKGKLPDGKRILGAHRPENLQLLDSTENASKNNRISYEELSKYDEGIHYLLVPDDYFKDSSKYPHIGFDVKNYKELVGIEY